LVFFGLFCRCRWNSLPSFPLHRLLWSCRFFN
jgi:hypothetical protein